MGIRRVDDVIEAARVLCRAGPDWHAISIHHPVRRKMARSVYVAADQHARIDPDRRSCPPLPASEFIIHTPWSAALLVFSRTATLRNTKFPGPDPVVFTRWMYRIPPPLPWIFVKHASRSISTNTDSLRTKGSRSVHLKPPRILYLGMEKYFRPGTLLG